MNPLDSSSIETAGRGLILPYKIHRIRSAEPSNVMTITHLFIFSEIDGCPLFLFLRL